MMTTLLIHIGYPKTASTWLQQTIFNNIEAGFLSPWGTTSGLAVDQFITTNSFRFSPKQTYAVFEPGLMAAAQQSLIPVLSQEMLSCDQVAGRYWGKEVADRLYAVFPDAHILILIREQKSMIYSSYGQYIKNGGMRSIQQFVCAEVMPVGFSPICRLDCLEYDLLISYYQELFGQEHVLVLPFEWLKNSPQTFVNRILNFVGIRKRIDLVTAARNVSYKAFTLSLLRKMNLFLPPPHLNLLSSEPEPWSWKLAWKILSAADRWLPERVHRVEEERLKHYIADYVGSKFASSNQRTSQLIGMDLAKFGYDM
ncbi:MAG: sulfotransferase [Synechococcales cyanobacterium C42_A2020_086]|jgi:hypothetical protein|nr:sulfotransferase [Synechococcales cyanobacterium C42_A2020_086]